MSDGVWVLLAYRLPREPSAPRVTLWRKLRRLGVVQVVDGLVALPATAATEESLGWLADEVVEAGGDAWTWRATGSKRQDRMLRDQLRSSVTAEYVAVTTEAVAAAGDATRRTAERLRRRLREVEARDFIGPRERDAARQAVQRIVAAAETLEERAR